MTIMRDENTTEADAEDREYHDVDLALPISARCGARYPKYRLVCSRRAGHVNERHRSCDLSWTNEMAEQEKNRGSL